MNIQFLNEGSNNVMTWVFVALLVVLVVALLVVPMFTNKKRAKQTMDLHNSLRPGDVIKTVGGIIGTIKEIRQVSPNEKEMLIESGEGENKTTMWLDIQALYQVMSRVEQPATAPAPAAEEVSESTTAEEHVDTPAETVAAADETPRTAPKEDVIEQSAPVSEQPADETVAASEPAPEVAEQTEQTEASAPVAAEELVAEPKPAAKKPSTSKPKAATPAKKKPVSSKANSTKK